MAIEGLAEFMKKRDWMIAKINARIEEVRAELAQLEADKNTLTGTQPRAPRAPRVQGSRGGALANAEQEKVIAWLEAHGGPRQIADVAKGLGLDPDDARDLLGFAYRAGKIDRVGRGIYQKKSAPAAPAKGGK